MDDLATPPAHPRPVLHDAATLHRQVSALLWLASRAGGPLTRREQLWVSPFRPAGRKHTKPWALGADVAEQCLVVLADDGEAGRFPLVGSRLSDALVVLEETVMTHVGVELQPPDLASDFLFHRLHPDTLAACAAALDEAAVAHLAAQVEPTAP